MRLIAQNLPSDKAIQSIQIAGIPHEVMYGHADPHKIGSPQLKDGYVVVPRGVRTQIIVRPQARAFTPKGFIIEGGGVWLIHNIRVGVNSMFLPDSDAVPASVMRGETFKFDTIQVGMDFALDVSHLGTTPQPFVCDVIGDAGDAAA